jgi:UDP-N-acetylglucosamine diphosphorylase / glucose-1-phosphate thymidylyltransferase / UDP-N-acetylgalactosamine diphosphorylase / glucosamine-1-phosphate N-acetyltransferase / galactosamine-1-phosphate N-acetyltransferase
MDASSKIIIDGLFPFTLTRSALDIRVGIFTLREKWNLLSGQDNFSSADIPENIIPTKNIFQTPGTVKDAALQSAKRIEFPWHIFQFNDKEIRNDFALITKNRKSKTISSSNAVIAPENIFLEEGARVECCNLNASTGPIYIGKDTEIMEGSSIRGPFALCEGSVVKMNSRIYGATTIGPFCVVGGEIKNVMIFGYSNKAHDGYLGDAVIGEWCNLGAGTANSNMKNNAADVLVWNEAQKKKINAGLKCGLLMGDYSRSAINTSFNTGTITGVACNIFGSGLTPKFIQNFSWGQDNSVKYDFEKAIKDISNWKKLKNHIVTPHEIQVLKHIFDQQ